MSVMPAWHVMSIMHAQAAHTVQLVQGAAACTALSMYHTRFHVDCYIAAGWFYKASNGY